MIEIVKRLFAVEKIAGQLVGERLNFYVTRHIENLFFIPLSVFASTASAFLTKSSVSISTLGVDIFGFYISSFSIYIRILISDSFFTLSTLSRRDLLTRLNFFEPLDFIESLLFYSEARL
jgi:hypothetical protein